MAEGYSFGRHGLGPVAFGGEGDDFVSEGVDGGVFVVIEMEIDVQGVGCCEGEYEGDVFERGGEGGFDVGCGADGGDVGAVGGDCLFEEGDVRGGSSGWGEEWVLCKDYAWGVFSATKSPSTKKEGKNSPDIPTSQTPFISSLILTPASTHFIPTTSSTSTCALIAVTPYFTLSSTSALPRLTRSSSVKCALALDVIWRASVKVLLKIYEWQLIGEEEVGGRTYPVLSSSH